MDQKVTSLSDVLQYAMGLLESTVFIMADISIEGNKTVLAILSEHFKLGAAGFADSLEARKGVAKLIGLPGRQEIAKPPPSHLFARVSQQFEPRLIDVNETSFRVQRLVAERGVLEKQFEALLALAKSVLGAFALGDV